MIVKKIEYCYNEYTNILLFKKGFATSGKSAPNSKSKKENPMSIHVTGGAGYIGSHTCVELLNAGYEIVVLDNLCNAKKEVLGRITELTGKQFPFYEIDIRDSAALTQMFQKENIEAVIHFAGLKAVGESCEKPLEYYDNNVYGTVNLLQVMRAFDCKKLVFSSSATV